MKLKKTRKETFIRHHELDGKNCKTQPSTQSQPPLCFNTITDKCIDKTINCERCYQVRHWVSSMTVAGCKQSAFQYRARTWSIVDIAQIAPYSYVYAVGAYLTIAQEQQNNNTRFYIFYIWLLHLLINNLDSISWQRKLNLGTLCLRQP